MYINVSWFCYTLVTSVRFFQFGHLSISYHPPYSDQNRPKFPHHLPARSFAFTLWNALFWILSKNQVSYVRKSVCEYHLRLYRCTMPHKRAQIQHTGFFSLQKLFGKECTIWHWHFLYRHCWWCASGWHAFLWAIPFAWIIVTIIESSTTKKQTDPIFART